MLDLKTHMHSMRRPGKSALFERTAWRRINTSTGIELLDIGNARLNKRARILVE